MTTPKQQDISNLFITISRLLVLATMIFFFNPLQADTSKLTTEQEIDIFMQQLAWEKGGELKIITEPRAAKIYINGQLKGISPSQKGKAFVIRLAAGEKYHVTAKKQVDGKLLQASNDNIVVGINIRQNLILKLTQEKTLSTINSNDFVNIPAGCFNMGASRSEQGDDDEYPQHKVCISKDFYLQKTELTQAQWQAVMGSNPSNPKGKNLPVNLVNRYDVQKFIEKLNAQSDKKYRLPTEAEWEYAARAGSTSSYTFGDDESELGDYAWYSGNSAYELHPVGQKKANAWGLYDIHGNVYEWVSDWYKADYYQSKPSLDPQGAMSGSMSVNRGGSSREFSWELRSAYRSHIIPNGRSHDLGFRLVLVQD